MVIASLSRSRTDRQPAGRFHGAEELRLRLVVQAAARQRIHPHDRLGLVPRLEAMNRRQQELVRAAREPLQRRQRVRPPVQPVGRKRRLGAGRDRDQSIAGRPRRPSARPAADHRSAQRIVQAQQIVRVSLDRRVSHVEQRFEDREVVLEIVDRTIGILRRRPRQARAALFGRLRREHTMIGHAAGDRPDRRRARRRTARARGFPRCRDADRTDTAARSRRRWRSSAAGARRCRVLPGRSTLDRGHGAARRGASGSSRGRCGTTRSASPGTKTTRKLRPRA